MVSSRPFGRLRVAILDYQPVVRTGLTVRLSSEMDIDLTGAYASSRALAEGLVRCPADVALLDYTPDPGQLSGLSLIRALHSRHPHIGIVVFSALTRPATVADALHCGARGFVGKNQTLDELIQAIRTVSRGAVYVGSGGADVGGMDAVAGKRDRRVAVPDGGALSGREKDVIRCFLGGMTVNEIAVKFDRSIKTISSQKSSAFRKLGVSSNTDLFRIRGDLEGL